MGSIGLTGCMSSIAQTNDHVTGGSGQTITFNATLSGENINNSKNPSSESCATVKPQLAYFKGLCGSDNKDHSANTEQVVFNNYQNAWGRGQFVLDEQAKTLSFEISYGGLSGPPIMAHFHVGSVKVAGPIIQTLCGPPPAVPPHQQGSANGIGYSAAPLVNGKCPFSASGKFKGAYQLKGQQCDGAAAAHAGHGGCHKITVEQQIEKLKSGEIYLNFHTLLNQPGEIRGQLVAQ